jgi:PRTRC genetic system protein A
MRLGLKERNKIFNKQLQGKEDKDMGYDAGVLRNASEKFGKNWSGGATNFKKNKQPDINSKIDQAIEKQSKKENVKKEETVVQPEITAADKMFFWNYLNDVQIGTFDPAALTKLNTWFIAGNGKWLIQKNKAGYFGIKKTDEGIPTLPEARLSNAFLSMAHGKIPEAILEQIIAFFRAVMAKHSGSEAFCQVYWDLQESKHVIHVPKQTVSGASVRYDATKNLDKSNPERYVFVYECHSHNNMGAFWSGTDNADEKDLRLYGVFGRLGQDKYEYKHRTIIGEEEVDVPLELIFDVKPKEPQYLVTMGETSAVVNQSDITVDDQPRYHVKVGDQVVQVTKDDIKRIEVKGGTYPSEWLNEVNTPAARSQVDSVYQTSGRHYGSGQYSGSPYLPKGEEEAEEGTAEPQESPLSDDFEARIIKAINTLDDETNSFEDVGSCLVMHEYLERRGLLGALKQSVLAYLGEFGGFDSNEPDAGDESGTEYDADQSAYVSGASKSDDNWDPRTWGGYDGTADIPASGYWP